MGLQSVLGWWITKCGSNGLQSVLGVGSQSVAKWITKCVRDYKVWQGGLQSVAGLQNELVQWVGDWVFTVLQKLKKKEKNDKKKKRHLEKGKSHW